MKAAKLRVALDDARGREAAAKGKKEAAEGKAAELQDRLKRREVSNGAPLMHIRTPCIDYLYVQTWMDLTECIASHGMQKSLQMAQSRCRSLEAELHRLRQLQNLKAMKLCDQEKERAAAQLASYSSEIEQLRAQCADMAAHLQQAVRLQEAALAAAEQAANERDSAGGEARQLRAQLERAQAELEAAAAAAAVVRSRLTASTSPMAVATSSASAQVTPQVEGALPDGIAARLHSYQQASPGGHEEACRELLAQLAAAECDKAEMAVAAQQHQKAAEALRAQCQALEAQLNSMKQELEASDESQKISSPKRQLSGTVAASTSRQGSTPACQAEYEALAATARQLDAALQKSMQQLETMSSELQDSRHHAANVQSGLHGRLQELAACRHALAQKDEKLAQLQAQLAAAQQMTAQQADTISAALRAEREAAAADFNALKAELNALAGCYQEAMSQLAAMHQHRDQAIQDAELTATRAAFHEQLVRARDLELQESAATCSSLAEDNRRLQAEVLQLRQEACAKACEAQVGSERAQAALERRAATAEGGTAVLQARMADILAQSEALQHRLALKQRKVEELEALLAQERARQCEQELGVHGESTAGVGVMAQRLAEAEKQCTTLLQERAALRAEVDTLQANLISDSGPGEHADLLAELAQVQAQLTEEQAYRQQTQEALQAVLREVQIQGGRSAYGARTHEPCDGSPAPNVQGVVERLHNIAQGLQALGTSAT